jgi:hypothetical protein
MAAQIEKLGTICRSAGWSPQVINGDLAQRDLPKALLRELRACSAAGEHKLVLQLCRTAAKLGIQHPRIKRARRQAQALLDSSLHSQLETAIKLREGGQPAASLALLDAALNAGHHSPWIDDNRARALVDLDRRAEAIPLWEQLQGHGDSAVADAARQMLDLQRQQLLVPLHDSVHQLAEQHAWPLQRLGDPTVLDLQAYSTSLLKEAIDARDIPKLNHRHLYRSARNFALAMAAIHRKGYVIGDVNFKNALFNDDALITVVDCDSMQVTDAQNIVHRCLVGIPEYTSPELQGQDFAKVNRSVPGVRRAGVVRGDVRHIRLEDEPRGDVHHNAARRGIVGHAHAYDVQRRVGVRADGEGVVHPRL